MRITPRSDQEAERVSRRILLKPGIHAGMIKEATEKPSKAGADMIELLIGIPDGGGVRLRAG